MTKKRWFGRSAFCPFQKLDNWAEGRLSRFFTPRRTAVWLIVSSLLCAAAMMASSRWIEDPERSETVHNLLLAVWWVLFSLTIGMNSAREQNRCREKA